MPARERRPDHDVVLTGVAVQQRRIGGEQDHEQRCVALTGDRFEPLADPHGDHPACVVAD